ncbi:DUF6252 family protein [Mucilaginibacter polytrichastri]|uniref:Uncharacterized protein n=1 Tax=Mucilaginibacter polytrichastri TaxID=1302689 RepID=A0A1Q6A6F9_9SPHI|nr:DUF6252 family protein [Mucilaginibacter polytrichastri]OKS89576.1 hypothetical protein RG47T_5060 [Mucilaginibacter polytrichastri]SFS69886.1 hypothetical protein SAMN04487890_10338 [Mucilaginibacter polytrichastri]
MKKITLLSLVLVSLLSACKKDNSTTKIEYSISAKKNNAVWVSANPYTGYVNPSIKDSILIIAHVGEETLGIKFKSKGVSTYQSTEINAYYWNTVGQDAIVATYNLSSDASNKLVINSYDEAKNLMRGSFSLTLKKTYGNSGFPTEVVFTNGELITYVQSPSVPIN